MHNIDGSMTCVKLDEDLYISSFIFGPLEFGKSVGQWEPVMTVNYPIEREITIGVTTSASTTSEFSAA